MSEFFLELFSEEIPPKLQINARKNLHENLKKFFEENEILIKGKLNVYSTPNRLIVYIDKITKQISKKSEEIRGPNVNSPDKALEGFLRSNNITKEKLTNSLSWFSYFSSSFMRTFFIQNLIFQTITFINSQ